MPHDTPIIRDFTWKLKIWSFIRVSIGGRFLRVACYDKIYDVASASGLVSPLFARAVHIIMRPTHYL